MRTIIFCVLVSFSWALPTEKTVATPKSQDEEAAQWVGEIFMNYTGETKAPEVNLDPVTPDNEVNCMTENNERGICTIYYLCDPESRTVITDGTTLIDVRERTCPHYLEVCCLENKANKADTPGNRNDRTTQKPSSMGDRLTTVSDMAQTPVLRPQAKASCGWSGALTSIFTPAANNDDRILADFGEFPWMVAVLVKRAGSSVWNLDDYRGGGALIHPAVVLTVAHAVKDVNQALKCRAGEWDTQTTREQFPFQERDVTDKLVHPKYSRQSLKFDFALLFLASAFELTQAPHIGVACLARALPPPGAVCYGMGWGRYANNETYAVVLKKVRQTLVGADECADALKESYGPFFRVHKSLTCALGTEGQDTCRGDGGSPLVCPVDRTTTGERRYVVAGLVAYGVDCGLADVPSVYANAPQARAWVDTEIAQRRLPALENV